MVHAQNRQEQQRWNKIDGEKKTEETNVKKNGNDWPCLQPNGSRFFFKRTKIIKIGGKIRKRAIFFGRQCGSEKKPNTFRRFLFLFYFFLFTNVSGRVVSESLRARDFVLLTQERNRLVNSLLFLTFLFLFGLDLSNDWNPICDAIVAGLFISQLPADLLIHWPWLGAEVLVAPRETTPSTSKPMPLADQELR